MALSEETRQKIEEKLVPFLKKGCPLCGNNKYSTQEEIFMHTVIDLKTKIQQHKSLYVLLVTCTKCFLTMSFDTKGAGITD